MWTGACNWIELKWLAWMLRCCSTICIHNLLWGHDPFLNPELNRLRDTRLPFRPHLKQFSQSSGVKWPFFCTKPAALLITWKILYNPQLSLHLIRRHFVFACCPFVFEVLWCCLPRHLNTGGAFPHSDVVIHIKNLSAVLHPQCRAPLQTLTGFQCIHHGGVKQPVNTSWPWKESLGINHIINETDCRARWDQTSPSVMLQRSYLTFPVMFVIAFSHQCVPECHTGRWNMQLKFLVFSLTFQGYFFYFKSVFNQLSDESTF